MVQFPLTTAATIRPADPASDAAAIAAIYNHYVAATIITFEEELVGTQEFTRRIEGVLGQRLPYLVAERDGRILGYAYATKWRDRAAYRFSVETTVYLDPEEVGRGLGTRLYAELFPLLLERGVHAAMAGIALPNEASVALHEKIGMRKVAHFEQVGFKLDRWIDVGYWQSTF